MTAITVGQVDWHARWRAVRAAVGSLLAAVRVVGRALRGLADLNDVLHVVGAALVSVGAWLAWEPAGFLVGGLLLLAAGALGVGERS